MDDKQITNAGLRELALFAGAGGMKYGSVCSGIEAASVAWHPMGWTAAWLAEIEAFPSAVLAHHYPDVPNLGDMTTLSAKVLTGEIEAPDVLVGGTPCQSFSVAGMRQGMNDPRGQLTIKYVELANAIDHVRRARGENESIIVWENVPGVLSDKGNAFGCFLGALAGEDDELQPSGGKWSNAGVVFGPQRTIAWRVLDAQYFGVAQRRRRVFLVASARKDVHPAQILFEWEGVRRDIAPSRGAREETARCPEPRIASGKPSVGTLIANAGTKLWLGNQEALTGDYHILQPTISVHGTQDPDINVEQAHTLGRNSGQENAIAYGLPGNWIGREPKNGGNAVAPMIDVAPCQTKTDVHGVAYGWSEELNALRELQPTIQRGGAGGRHEGVAYGVSESPHTAHCLRSGASKADKHESTTYVDMGMSVRRLTPVECERLQGFPDGYTQVPWRGKPAEECPDGGRYKALGNSMAVPCMAFIGQQIRKYTGWYELSPIFSS